MGDSMKKTYISNCCGALAKKTRNLFLCSKCAEPCIVTSFQNPKKPKGVKYPEALIRDIR